MAAQTQWVAVDWGTSNVRAWGIAADQSQTFSAQADKGMGRISRTDYPAVLTELIGGRFPDGEIVVCGMAGARQGWIEAPYLETPADLHSLSLSAVTPPDVPTGYRLRILPGICQRAPGHEDVMRGEETQLLGLLALQPGFEGTAVLPGHPLQVGEDSRRERRAVFVGDDRRTLRGAIRALRASPLDSAASGWGALTEAGIAEGMEVGLEHPELFTALAFRTRAAALLSDKGPDWCSGYLSGLLVGTEIGGHRDWLDGDTVPLIGSARFGRLYGATLSKLGIKSIAIDAAEATIAGLQLARAQ